MGMVFYFWVITLIFKPMFEWENREQNAKLRNIAQKIKKKLQETFYFLIWYY